MAVHRRGWILKTLKKCIIKKKIDSYLRQNIYLKINK